MSTDTHLAEFIKEIQEQFLGQAEKFANDFEALRIHIPENAEATERLATMAHSMAGNAGTFGFLDIGVAAAHLEETIYAAKNRAPACSNTNQDIDNSLATLIALLRSLKTTPS